MARDRARGAAEHPLGLDADRVDLAGARVDRDDRGLGEHDAAPTHVDERVRGAEVDGHVAAAETGQVAEKTHVWVREVRASADSCRAERAPAALAIVRQASE